MSLQRYQTRINGILTWAQALTTSAGAADANKIVATGSNGRLDQSLLPPGVGNNSLTAIASEALGAGDFINIWSNAGTRNIRKADASNGRPAHGYVLSAVASGQSGTALTTGENTSLTGLTIGTLMFLSPTTAGTATATAPTIVGHIIQPLGVVQSTNSIAFESDEATTIA
jgi:hypothetical protein